MGLRLAKQQEIRALCPHLYRDLLNQHAGSSTTRRADRSRADRAKDSGKIRGDLSLNGVYVNDVWSSDSPNGWTLSKLSNFLYESPDENEKNVAYCRIIYWE